MFEAQIWNRTISAHLAVQAAKVESRVGPATAAHQRRPLEEKPFVRMLLPGIAHFYSPVGSRGMSATFRDGSTLIVNCNTMVAVTPVCGSAKL